MEKYALLTSFCLNFFPRIQVRSPIEAISVRAQAWERFRKPEYRQEYDTFNRRHWRLLHGLVESMERGARCAMRSGEEHLKRRKARYLKRKGG